MDEQTKLGDELQVRAKGDEISLAPGDHSDAISALDSLAQEEAGDQPVEGAEKLEAETSGKPAEAKADEKTETPADPEVSGKTAEQLAAEKAAADKAAVDKAAADEANKNDALEKIQLPPHTKPKSAEAFGLLKQTARTEIAAREAKLAEFNTKLTELQAELDKAKARGEQISPEVQSELEDLRRFKLSHDVESDPSFREFDGKLKSNTEAIYKRLGSALTAEQVKQVKDLGGPEAVDWEPILPKLPLPVRRFIEAKLVENEQLRDNRDEALTKAKQNAGDFLKERTEREVRELTDSANHFIKQLPWTAEKPIPANSTPEQRAAIEAHNKFAQESSTRLKEYLSDRSPARLAELAVGTLIAHKQKVDLAATTAQLTAVTKDRDEKVAALTKERDKYKSDLEAVRRAEVPRGRGDAIVPPKPKAGNADFRSGAEALEDLAKEFATAED